VKKFVLIILSLLILDLFLAKSSLAATPTPSPSINPVILPGPNPAPPIGIPCGNTMCLENETCMQYPGDVDQHCVPKDKIPLTPPLAPPIDLPAGLDLCPKGEGVFPPNSSCINNFKNTQEKISEYQKTCIYEPVVQYESERWPDDNPKEYTQPFTMCGKGYAGPGNAPSPPGSIDKYDCSVNMLVYTDVRDAELGSYGPSTDAEDQYSIDFIAQNYLYNSLFGRPLDLSDKNREAYRTYWRLLSASTQANLRSFTLNMANKDQINNIEFEYTDTNGIAKKTDFKKLYDVLNKQVILFGHFPFVRIGCLTDYPVCPEYAQAVKGLGSIIQDLLDAAAVSNIPGVSQAAQIYSALVAAFGGDVDGPYAAFVPLDFDSIRSYIVMKPTPDELAIYTYGNARTDMLIDQLNVSRYPNKPPLSNVSRENIPYLGAIYQGLLSPKFGILSSLQPSWLLDTYATPGGTISDYKRGNAPEDFPEVKIAKRNFLEALKEEAAALISNPLGWIYEQIKDIFTNEEDTNLKGYTKNDKDLPIDKIRPAYVNFKGCPLPISYHLLSPKTAAEESPIPPGDPKYNDHHQVVTIWGPQVAWSWNPIPFSTKRCYTPNPTIKNPHPSEICVCTRADDNIDQYPIDDCNAMKRHWTVSGTEHGKALTVLNNPKATDIKNAIIDDDKFSLYKTLIPDVLNKKEITDASIDAPYAANYSAYRNSDDTATAPNGTQTLLNEVEPINRINNLAQDSMHILQNCWVVPEGLQNSPRCDLSLSPEATTSACTGEAFEKITGEKTPPSPVGENFFNSFINPKLTPEVISAYAEAEKSTGVPCEVLAGIHFKEGDNNPDQDLQSGAPLAGRSLTESAIVAAEELKAKAGGAITTINQLIMALSAYNGGGNSNCQAGGSNSCAPTDRCGQTVACTVDASACRCVGTPEPGSCRANCPTGFPYPFSYPYCPPASTGYDDPYVTNYWISPVHDQMYILYMYDCTQTRPYLDARPGTLTVAISLFLQETK